MTAKNSQHSVLMRAIICMIAAVFFFSVMTATLKLIVDDFSLPQLVFLRNAFAMPVIMWLIYKSSITTKKILVTARPLGHLVRTGLGMITMCTVFISFDLLPLADAVAIHFAMPIIATALAALILKEKVGIMRWGAVLLGFVGIIIIAKPSGNGAMIGQLVALLAAFLMAFNQILVKQMSRTEESLTLVFYFTVYAMFGSAFAMIFAWTTPDFWQWCLFILMGTAGGLGQYFLTSAYASADSSIVSPFNYTSIIFATLFGWLIWNDIPGSNVFIGASIVIAAGLFIIYRETRRKAPATQVNAYTTFPTRVAKKLDSKG